MALTNAQIQRRYRERQKQKRLAALRSPDSGSISFLRRSFEGYLHEDGGRIPDLEMALELAGIVAPVFTDDLGPTHHANPNAWEDLVDDPFPEATQNSSGRAEVMVGLLIEAARALAFTVNEYKQSEIKERLAEIEQSDMSDPEQRKHALSETVRLTKTLEHLQGSVRWTFPQWKVADE